MEKKKILFLGGIFSLIDVVNKAKELGYYTIVTDYYDLERSPAKKVADKYYMISLADIDEVVKMIKEENISGVITGFTDSYLEYYYEICKKAGLPCYGNLEQFMLCTNKEKFKDICRKYGVAVIPEYDIKENYSQEDLKQIEYPVVVKPVDNSGSRGVFICHNEQEFISSFEEALSYSPTKNVLVEKYIEGDGMSWYYTIIDGTPILSAITDTTFYYPSERVAPMRCGQLFPSRHLKEYMDTAHNNVKNMIKGLGMKNGVLFLQGFYGDGKFLIYEPGYRLNGGSTYRLIEKCCGYNQIEMLINFAVTGKMTKEENILRLEQPDFNGNYGFLLVIPLKKGKIKKVKGVEKIKELPDVDLYIQEYFEGEEVKVLGTTRANFAYILIVSDTKKELANTIKSIHDNLIIENEYGEDMIFARYDNNELQEQQSNIVNVEEQYIDGEKDMMVV
ncbi:MAG: ATP-grasp domain-containing protein [Clostridia bacterium]|nr:ATP-grasp domain-containing protein [Clostridia bacterium]